MLCMAIFHDSGQKASGTLKMLKYCVDGTVCAAHVQKGACGLWVTALKGVALDCDPVIQCSANAWRTQTLLPTTVYIL